MEQKRTFVEVGPGRHPELHLYSSFVSEEFADAIKHGATYIAIDPSRSVLGTVEEGAVANMSLQELADTDFLDNQVNVLFIANVFGEPFAAVGLQNPFWQEKVLKKLARMLVPGGSLIVVESYTPEIARQLLRKNFEAYGLGVETANNKEDIQKLFAEAGLTPSYVRNVLLGTSDISSEQFPFVIVAKKQTEV